MCGITGIFNFQRKNSIDKALLKRMTDILIHRGPDSSDYYWDSYCGLGHRRLSIIDLSSKAKQPMCNEDKSIWIVFNGEIYNFLELKKELEIKHHKFKSDSDTEVIIHGYEEYGDKIVEKLRGMFAFAVWDSDKKQLFLARDRVGKKPLFYYADEERFVFASELKAIIQDPTILREINLESVSHYLSYGYVPAPLSIFKDIFKLLPGHYLVVNNQGEVKITKYWDLVFNPSNYSEEYCTERILQELEEATRIRMISDVPLGAFLSGGVDSSAVVALMAKNSSEPIKTFSIGFEESSFDETKYARIVAEKFGTDHKEFIVKPDAIKILPKLVWYYNEPFADSSALPSYYVANITKKYVTVALNGDGGDESFAGYDRYAVNRAMNYYQWIPKLARYPFEQILLQLPEPAMQKNWVDKMKRFINIASCSPEDQYIRLMMTFQNEAKSELCTDKLNHLNVNSMNILRKEFIRSTQLDFQNRLLYVDVKRYLPDDLLVKMDIAAMANSLEARSPFLDHKLMEFAATIPPKFKLNGFEKKYILKKALLPILPKEILYRKKQGFGVPIGDWFRNDLYSYASDILLDQRAISRGYFRADKIKNLLSSHLSKKKNHAGRIWNLLWLELWHRTYVDEISIKHIK